jgi:hypothetical protein
MAFDGGEARSSFDVGGKALRRESTWLLAPGRQFALNRSVNVDDGRLDPTRDTDPAAERLLIEAYRAMPPWRKIKIVQDLNRATAALAIADIRRRHPSANEREVLLRLASRRIDPELLRRHFGWDVRVQGY